MNEISFFPSETRMFPPSRSLRSKGGSVLALVLALVILMAFIAVAFLEEAKEQILYDALFHKQEDMRAEAYSALDTTLAVLNVFHEIDEGLWGPRQGWHEPLAFAGYEPLNGVSTRVHFRDESGRFPLSRADFDLLLRVFDKLGFDRAESEELADSLLDWMDEDDLRRLNGFDGDDYRRLNPPLQPANAMVRSWDELELIPAFQELFWENGVPRPELQMFTDAFSLRHSGAMNVNAVSPFVAQILEEMGAINSQNLFDYLAGPDREPGTEDDRVVRSHDVGGIFTAPDDDGLVGTTASLLEVSVEVSRGEAVFLLRSLVSWRGANPGAAAGESAGTESTRASRGTQDSDQPRRARGSAETATGDAAQLGYPFQILWLAENHKN